jgi:hypothetical protein
MQTTFAPNPHELPRSRADQRITTRRSHPDNPLATRMARDRRATAIMVAAALVAMTGMVVVTMLEAHSPIMTEVIAPQTHGSATTQPTLDSIDHSVIRPDAPVSGDAETVEASVAAYER